MLWVLIRIAAARRFAEAIQMSTHSIGFNEDLTTLSFNYHQISSNMHLVLSAGIFFTIKRLCSENSNTLKQDLCIAWKPKQYYSGQCYLELATENLLLSDNLDKHLTPLVSDMINHSTREV